MNPDRAVAHRRTAAPSRMRQGVIERLAALANRHLATGDVPRLFERWVDDPGRQGFAWWTERNFPAYEIAFNLEVRGRELPAFLDYHAGSTYLALYAYWPVRFAPEGADGLLRLINEINWDLPYGGFELRDENLRYCHGLDVDGLRIAAGFLDSFVEHARLAFEMHAGRFLGGPAKVAPSTQLKRTGDTS